jgi:hypothetical protein
MPFMTGPTGSGHDQDDHEQKEEEETGNENPVWLDLHVSRKRSDNL